jgi:hypothetical protein
MLNDECGWKDGDRSAVVLQTIKEMRMEETQQHQGDVAENTEMSACHFLHGDCMDLGHPSRLPDGSLRSAWTGPGRDPQGFTHTRKWQALYRRRWFASHWSAPNCCPSRANEI